MRNISILIFVIALTLANGQLATHPTYLPGPNMNSKPQFYNAATQTTIAADFCTDYQLNAGNTFMNYGTVRVCNTQYYIYIGVYATEGYNGAEAVKAWIGTNLTLLNTVKGKQTTLPVLT